MKLNKIFKLGMVLLIIVSIAILVWGFVSGFAQGTGADAVALPPTNVLLTWAAIMILLALFAWIVIGLLVNIKNDPKSLVKMGIGLVGVAALCLVAFLFAKGNPAIGTTKVVSAGMLKLTDTILNLTMIVGIGAILAIIAGEIRMAIANKK